MEWSGEAAIVQFRMLYTDPKHSLVRFKCVKLKNDLLVLNIVPRVLPTILQSV